MESKTESKLRLDFFLAQGLKLARLDIVANINGTELVLDEYQDLDVWNTVEDCNKKCFIKSLAPRENKGVQPVGDNVVVDVVYYDGYVETSLASVLDWSLNIGHPKYLIDTWSPNLDALIELQEKHKVTQVKPEVDYWVVTTTETGWVARIAKHGLSVYVKDVLRYGYSVRIRPVYKKRDTHHSK